MGLPVAMLAISAVSTGIQVYGQIKAGRAQKKAANTAATFETEAGVRGREVSESEASLSDYNQSVAELQATDAVERGADAESRYRTQVRGVIGTQKAIQAGGNIDVNFGSAVDVQADAAFLGEMDALQIRTNAAREQWGFKVQAEDYRRRAQIQRKEGVNRELTGQATAQGLRAAGNAASSASKVAAVGTIIGGASSLLQTAYGFRNS